MTYKEILARITGFSVPVFGVSWSPSEPDIDVAHRVIVFLEDRRVLYNPYHLEIAWQCVDSVVEIRKFLTEEIGKLDARSELSEHLRGMRAACRRFLDGMSPGSRRHVGPCWGGRLDVGFLTALGELRSTLGHHVAALAVMHGLDVEGDLAETLPPADQSDG